MTGALFEITFLLAAPFWLLMIFAPGRRVTARVAASPLTVLPVLVLYAVMAVPVFPELWTAVSSPDIDTFRDLTVLANGAGAVWAQIIAWDLLLGQWMFLEARRLGVSPYLMGPLLVLTVLLSPVGLVVFLAIRATRKPGARLVRRDAEDGAAVPG
ncbi:ABA4-like family protein [Streptomyces sp. NBC_01102]|uniref:ABA4-like family protein n=1 Tax=Streptomyces sp. NBC_01102 TaxID=2903749 RepID=UPI00386D3858|nr:ABA4-like family protein [Streptomyces sp. NBC_01102]